MSPTEDEKSIRCAVQLFIITDSPYNVVQLPLPNINNLVVRPKSTPPQKEGKLHKHPSQPLL